MLRKITFYGLSVAILFAFAYLSRWGELKFPNDALRADVASEEDVAPESVAFLTDYREATQKAARENKPALLFFMAKNCKFSANMLSDAFANAEVEKLSKEFVCVEIDMTDSRNAQVCEDYKITVTPTVQFVNPQGAPLQRLTSAQTAERLADQMQAALTSVAWRAARQEDRGILLR